MTEWLIFRPEPPFAGQHPAFMAWERLGEGRSTPASIEALTSHGRPASTDSSVYRLNGIGPGGGSVIAKRARREGILVEQFVYRKILPALPLTRVHCYGFVEESQRDYCWLFLDDAGGDRYSESIASHRALASVWLGVLHAGTARSSFPDVLPAVGPERYLYYLTSARATIQKSLANAWLGREDRWLLERILLQLASVETFWDELVSVCRKIPPCLFHGDFIPKNVRVRTHGGDVSLFVIDWEAAGWGVPAEDVAGLDTTIYLATYLHCYPHAQIDSAKVERLETVGRMFRYLAWIQATSAGLACEWIEQTMEDLKHYEVGLARLLRTWTEIERQECR